MNIKEIASKLFGKKEQGVTINVIEGVTPTTEYARPEKADRELTQQLYHNTNSEYSLAAHFVKTIINNNVNFIGIPKVYDSKKIIDIIEEVNIDYRKIHKALEIDGSIFVWPQWDNAKEKIKLVQIPISVVDKVFVDPLTKEITGYKFKEKVNYNTPTHNNCTVDITYVITADIIVTQVTGSMTKLTKSKNMLGVLPIVHFSNDKDVSELYGHSEIENIQPQLKFYHDLTYEAGAAQSRDGHPKLKVTTKNVKQWIENNFGAGSFAEIQAGNRTVSMESKDLFINAEGDDVNYLYLNKTSGDYSTLAEIAFSNIVEGSEVPEINFGANIGTSLASVKEYRPIWIKKIEAKQYERTEPWMQVYNIIVSIYNFVHLSNLKPKIKITWPKPNFASVKEQAEIIAAFANAIDKLQKSKNMSREEAYNTLVNLDVVQLAETFKKHKEVIDDEQENEKANAPSEETIDDGAEKDDESDTKDA